LVLSGADGLSSLAAAVSAVAELLEGRFDAMTASGVHWGARSALVATVSHFLELENKLGVLGSGCSSSLIEDETDAL
jgi:hypothetical protein